MIFGIEGEVMGFDKLRGDLPNSESLEQRDQSEIDTNGGAKNNSLSGGADRILNLVGPDVFHRL